MEPAVRIERVTDTATVPTKGSCSAAGWDLYADEHVAIPARGRAMVSTGIRMAIPDDYFGKVMPRSGLTVRHGLDVGAGVIDADYRGVVHVVLFNHSDDSYTVECGTRIAQLVFLRCAMDMQLREVQVSTQETKRSVRGFGSTGMV